MNKKNFSLRDCFLGVGILFLGIGSQLNAQNIKAVDDNILIGVNQPKSFEPLINDNKNVLNLDVKIISSPKFGSANISNSTFEISYSPNTSFQGRDTLTYEICDLDNVEPCSQAKVLFKVGKVALNPTANNDADSTGENKLITIDVLKNDIVTTVGAMKVQIDVNPKFGSAVVIANKIQYTPNLNFSGHDTLYYALVDTFTFQQGGRVDSMDVGRLAIYVNDLHSQGNEIGDTIFLPQVSIRTKNVLINNIDTENDKLFVSGYGSKLTNNNDSTFTYKPASGFTGIDILTYQVCSDLSNNIAKRQCVTDSVIIVVMPASINKAPVLTVNPVRDSIYFGQTGSVQLFATEN